MKITRHKLFVIIHTTDASNEVCCGNNIHLSLKTSVAVLVR